MKKILFINTVFGKGSTGRIVKELGEAFQASGGEFRVAFGRGKPNDTNGYRIGNDLDLYSHALAARCTGKVGFFSQKATLTLIKYITEFNPDIIHLHNLHGYYLNLPILFNYLRTQYSGRIVWTLHDCWAFTGHCCHFTQANCYKWETQCGNCMQIHSYPYSYIDSSRENFTAKKRLFSELKDLTIVAVSDWLKDMAKRSFLNQYPIERIYNGINLNHFVPTSSRLREKRQWTEKKLVLSVADGFDKGKGLDRLLNIAAQAPSDWVFVIVGIAPKDTKALPDNVIGFCRTSSPKELIEFYSSADVFFNPSLEETFGLVTLEAMACGTPVIVMNSTASPELIVNNSCGAVLECNSSTEEAIKTIASAMHKKGARQGAMEFSIERQIAAYMDLFMNTKA